MTSNHPKKHPDREKHPASKPARARPIRRSRPGRRVWRKIDFHKKYAPGKDLYMEFKVGPKIPSRAVASLHAIARSSLEGLGGALNTDLPPGAILIMRLQPIGIDTMDITA